jgi:hypothetical protein
MNGWKIVGSLMCVTLAGARLGFAQTPPSPRVFVDGAVMAERDTTAFFYGSDAGTAGRAAVGVRLSERNSLRFEVDVPRWHVNDTASSGPVWCAREARCVGGEGLVPARTTSHTAVRTVSYSFLYARHLPAMGRVQVALLAGGSMEERGYRSSSSFDELGPDGHVVRHVAGNDDRIGHWPAGVLGIDAEVSLTSHLAVIPQFRFHTLPYPAVSISRPGIALRWRF